MQALDASNPSHGPHLLCPDGGADRCPDRRLASLAILLAPETWRADDRRRMGGDNGDAPTTYTIDLGQKLVAVRDRPTG